MEVTATREKVADRISGDDEESMPLFKCDDYIWRLWVQTPHYGSVVYSGMVFCGSYASLDAFDENDDKKVMIL